MKQNYKKNRFNQLILLVALLIGTLSYSQNIMFTFENAVNTNDGTNDFYEADIMIQTIGGQADFKLGSGQIYFNYNMAAFGQNVKANGKFSVSAPYNAGEYFLGQTSGFTQYYTIPGVINDNTISRVSWAFTQGVSSGAMTELVTAVPRKLLHIKFQYIDVNQVPMVAFENDNVILDQATDQFFTACGPHTTATAPADCTNFPGTQFVGATFDNNGAVLAVDQNEIVNANIKIYPNPVTDILNINSLIEIKNVEMFDLLGKRVIATKQTNQIEVSQLPVGVYFLKAHTENGTITKKVVIE